METQPTISPKEYSLTLDQIANFVIDPVEALSKISPEIMIEVLENLFNNFGLLRDTYVTETYKYRYYNLETMPQDLLAKVTEFLNNIWLNSSNNTKKSPVAFKYLDITTIPDVEINVIKESAEGGVRLIGIKRFNKNLE